MKFDFTQEEKNELCWRIGEWYIKWKDRLIDYENKTHNLGRAKEELKLIICDNVDPNDN